MDPVLDSAITLDSDPEIALRARRFIQIAGFTLVALTIRAIVGAFDHDQRGQTVIAGGIAMILLSLWLNRKAYAALAHILLMTSLVLMVSVLIWVSEGIFDVVVLAYPGLLIMAGLMLRPRYFVGLFIFIVATICFITYAAFSGLHEFQPSGNTFDRFTDTLLILLLSGSVAWTMTNDLHQVLQRLKQEITTAQKSQERLSFLAQHDSLTNLPNRLLGRELIERSLSHAQRHGERVALLFVDLDNFKTVNDTLGHSAGDEFLKEVGLRLMASVRASDIVCRQGGDEFLICVAGIGDLDAISTAASHVLSCLAAPFDIRGTHISSSCSIGIAVFPDDGVDFDALLRLSDIGMYQAKESGRNMYRFYDEGMNSNIVHNLHLATSLRLALPLREFILHYQPTVDLVSGKLIGAEALIRWQHSERGLIPPAEFIPVAERSGLIVDIGEWVIDEACRQMMAWQAAGAPEFVLAVNLSPVQFRRGNLESILSKALARSGLNPACLELELTESTLIQNADEFIKSLHRLKALGIKIAIDDFGTGYSNLSYLQRFEVDKLKIDQSFVRRLNQSPQDLAIVNAIIQMAKSLNLTTTAEGIEEESIRQQLIELGCDEGQGYLFAKPQAAAQFQKLIGLKADGVQLQAK
jgi:diguanylate cyclase (GGDEF)-like protein